MQILNRSKLFRDDANKVDVNTAVGQSFQALDHPLKRFAALAPPAAGITMALFLVMGSLIATDFVPVPQTEQRVIGTITPEEVDIDEPEVRPHPEKILAADAPPPPPKLTLSKADVDLPTPDFGGAEPTPIAFDPLEAVTLNPINIIERDIEPIRHPVLTYPNEALRRELEGECVVAMDVDITGRPYNIEANCTDRVFVRAAEKAVSRAEFAPKVESGRRVERKNVVYPIVFSLNE